MKDRDRSFFECKLSKLKRLKLDTTETYQQTNKNIVHASYLFALQVSRIKKAQTIGEILVKPYILELVLGEEESKKMKQISVTNAGPWREFLGPLTKLEHGPSPAHQLFSQKCLSDIYALKLFVFIYFLMIQ